MLTPATIPTGLTIPTGVTDEEGRSWTITRAWPAAAGQVTFEAASASSPHVRGGRLTPADGAVLAPLGVDPRLPDLAEHAATGTIVVHRPGRRAVLRSQDGSRFIKVVRPGRAGSVRDAQALADDFAGGFRIAAVLAGTGASVQFGALAGRTVHDLGADTALSQSAWAGIWAEWASAWTAAVTGGGASVAQPASARPAPARAHGAGAEIDVIATWAGHARRLLGPGAPSAALTATAERVAGLLTGTAQGELVISHRDLHDKQLLWHPGDGLGLLDLDTATRAEAALDLGNLAAHALLRREQGLWSADRTRTVRGIVRDVAGQLQVSPDRLHAYETAARFRIGCVYLYRPRWAALAGRVQRELAEELGRTPFARPDEDSLIGSWPGSHQRATGCED